MWAEEIVAGRPAWRHIPSGVAFREVPGGTFRMGPSEAELHAVRAIERGGGVDPFLGSAQDAQPVRAVRVERPPARPGSKATWTTCSPRFAQLRHCRPLRSPTVIVTGTKPGADPASRWGRRAPFGRPVR